LKTLRHACDTLSSHEQPEAHRQVAAEILLMAAAAAHACANGDAARCIMVDHRARRTATEPRKKRLM